MQSFSIKSLRLTHFLVIFGLIGISLSIFSNIYSTKAAFGVSPPWINNDHMLPGTSDEQVVNLSRSDTGKEMKAEFEISGDEKLIKWIEIENEEDLIIRKGEKILPVKFTINVPERVALRKYKGNISAGFLPIIDKSSPKGGSVAIALGGNIDVNIDVIGEKITDFKIRTASADTAQEGAVFGFNLDVENTGNTDINEIKGEIEILNYKQTETLHSLEMPAFRHTVEAYERLSQKVFFRDTSLPAGEYRVKIKIFKDDVIVYENTLFQKVEAKSVAKELNIDKPSMPQAAKEELAPTEASELLQISIEDLNALKSAAPVDTNNNNKYFIAALAGIGFGLLALIGLIVVLVFVLKGRRSEV